MHARMGESGPVSGVCDESEALVWGSPDPPALPPGGPESGPFGLRNDRRIGVEAAPVGSWTPAEQPPLHERVHRERGHPY